MLKNEMNAGYFTGGDRPPTGSAELFFDGPCAPDGPTAVLQPSPKGRMRAALREVRRVHSLCGGGMLTALNIVLNQFKLILTPTLQISAAFLATAVSGWAYGPVLTAMACGIADILKYLLRPDGPFNLVWTAVAFVPGVLYGLVLYRRPVTLWRTALAKALVTAVVNLGLNPLCMAWLYGTGSYWYFLSARLVKNLVLLPFETALLYGLLRIAQKALPRLAQDAAFARGGHTQGQTDAAPEE